MSETYIQVPLAGSHLASFQNELLAVSPNGSVSSYSIGSKGWIGKGSVSPVAYAQNPFVANTAFQQNPSADTLGGVTVCAWEDSRGGVRFSIYDESTRQPLMNDQVLDSAGTNPHVCAGGNYLVILWANGGDLLAVGIQPQAPTVIVGPNPIASNAATASGTPFAPTLCVDLITNASDSTSCLFAYTNTSGYAEIGYIYSNTGLGLGPVVGTSLNGYVAPVATTINADQSIALIQAFSPGLQQAFLLAAYSTTGLQSASIPADLVVTNTQTVDASVYISNCGGVVSGKNPLLASIVYESTNSAGSTWNHFCNFATISTTLAPSTSTQLVRSLGMASQPTWIVTGKLPM